MDDVLRVALIDDDVSLRSSLRLLIDGSPGLSCVGDWPTIEAAVKAASLRNARVLLLDLHLPGIDGDEGLDQILARHPDLLVVMFTSYDDDQKVFASLCNGACGYLLKSTTPSRLLEALHEVAGGGSPMSPTIARKVVRLFRFPNPQPPQEHSLTPRELELLSLLSDGHSYQSAASQLGISTNTVRNHIRAIYDKLHVHTQTEAVSKALRAGLI